jgi:hypothetical protein
MRKRRKKGINKERNGTLMPALTIVSLLRRCV